MGKKIGLFICIILVVCIGIGITIFLLNKEEDTKEDTSTTMTTKEVVKEYVTLTFDTDGGDALDPMEVVKGDKVELPTATKKGFVLAGWYVEDTLIEKEAIFKENTTLKAKWEKAPKEVKQMKISFDSKGGSKVNDITVECDKALKLPKNPTKEGYTFVSWADKKGKTILNGAKLTCEDLTLYATWEKGTTSTTTTTTTTKKTSVEPSKTYKCPDGYELVDKTKCIDKKDVERYCPEGFVESKKDSSLCYTYRGEATKKCLAYKGYETGSYFDNTHGNYGCAYGSRDSYPTQETCSNSGNVYNSAAPGNHCWQYIVTGSSQVENTCSGIYVYRTASDFGTTANSGCYELKQKESGCKNYPGYSYNPTLNKCVKTIDATLS